MEAASLAGHLGLGKLIAIYDDNKVSLAGPTSVTFTEDVGARFDAYGWHVQNVPIDESNNADAISEAIDIAKNVTDRPSIILVRSHIGYDSPTAGLVYGARRAARRGERPQDESGLGWPTEPAFFVPDDVLAWWRSVGERGQKLESDWNAGFDAWKSANPALAAQFERARDAKLPESIAWPAFNADNGAVATRDAGGTVMNAIAAALPELVGGSADLDPSTKTYLKDQGNFQIGTYEGRNVHFGVREFAMGAAANGMAAPRRVVAVHRDLLQLLRLHEGRDAVGRAQQEPHHLRLHARLGLPG